MVHQNQLQLNAVFQEDKKGRGFSGYFAEFPKLMAQGKMKLEVEQKLLSSLKDMLEYKKGQSLFANPAHSEIDTINLIPA